MRLPREGVGCVHETRRSSQSAPLPLFLVEGELTVPSFQDSGRRSARYGMLDMLQTILHWRDFVAQIA
jgi:hypothetical protein